MLNIAHYWRNANQNYNEISSHTSHNGHYQKVYKHKCWRRCGEKGRLLHCWWECKLIQPLWKMVWRFFKKLGIKTPYDPAIPLLGIYFEETRNLPAMWETQFRSLGWEEPLEKGKATHSSILA